MSEGVSAARTTPPLDEEDGVWTRSGCALGGIARALNGGPDGLRGVGEEELFKPPAITWGAHVLKLPPRRELHCAVGAPFAANKRRTTK